MLWVRSASRLETDDVRLSNDSRYHCRGEGERARSASRKPEMAESSDRYRGQRQHAMNLPIEVAGEKALMNPVQDRVPVQIPVPDTSPVRVSNTSRVQVPNISRLRRTSSGVSEYAAREVEGYYNGTDRHRQLLSPPWATVLSMPGPCHSVGGFGFGGFFILNDFERHDHFHHFSNM